LLNTQALLRAFGAVKLADRTELEGGDPQWHLANIAGTFDALADVFEKQTKSPAIKSCYDLRDLAAGGAFLHRLGVASDDALVVVTAGAEPSPPAQPMHLQGRFAQSFSHASLTFARALRAACPFLKFSGGDHKSLEYLLDLRSKLLMAEVPAELDAEFGASALIASFVQQLQVMADTSAALRGLFAAGHATYCRAAFTLERPIATDALPAMHRDLKALMAEADEWSQRVKASRDEYFFLNYYTMRDILHLKQLVELPTEPLMMPPERPLESSAPQTADPIAAAIDGTLPGDGQGDQGERRDGGGGGAAAEDPGEPPPSTLNVELETVCAMGFPADHAAAALRRCGGNVEAAVEFLFGNSQHMDRMVAEDAQRLGAAAAASAAASGSRSRLRPVMPSATPLEELTAMLHAVSSTVDEAAVPAMADRLRARLASGDDLLVALGTELDLLFGSESAVRSIPPPGAAAASRAGWFLSHSFCFVL
jgi:hypothetical protein